MRKINLVSGVVVAVLSINSFLLAQDTTLTITSGGNVGIGTVQPTQKLDVVGTVQMSGFRLPTGAQSGYILTSDTSGVGTWQQASGGLPVGTFGQTLRNTGANWLADSLLFNDGANVGIGTTNPTEKFEVNGNIEVNGYLKYAGGQQHIGFHNSGGVQHLTLNAGGVEYISIKDGVGTSFSSGDVGIGTASPAEKLDVVGTVQMTGFKLPTNAQKDYVLTSDSSGLGTWQLAAGGLPSATSGQTLRYDGADWVANSLLFNNGTSIGIGTTTPGGMFHLSNGTSIFTYGNGAPHLSEAGVSIGTAFNARHGLAIRTSNNLIGDPNHASLWIENVGLGGYTFYAADQANDTTPFVITLDGDVGIGTATPDQLLSVNGNASKVGGGSWATFSDRRLKKDIHSFTDGLSVLREIHPVTFRYNGKLGYPTERKYVGVIAQEMQSIAPYTVDTYRAKLDPGDMEDTDVLRFDPSALIYIAVNAINELDARVQEIEELRRENHALSSRLTELESLVKSLADSKEEADAKLLGEVRRDSSPNPE